MEKSWLWTLAQILNDTYLYKVKVSVFLKTFYKKNQVGSQKCKNRK
jgi:hypothetical protein